MLKILIVINCLLVVIRGATYEHPGRFRKEDVVSRWQHRHIHNMTENILKDAMYKRRHADVVQTRYKGTHSYELGMISEGVMEHYRHMIVIYRHFSNAKDFKNNNHNIRYIMNSYAIIQSDYNEIVHETVLFYQVLNHHLQTQSLERREAARLSKRYKLPPALILNIMRAGFSLRKLIAEAEDNDTSTTDSALLPMRMMISRRDLNDTFLDTDSLEGEAFSRKINGIFKGIEMGGFEDPEFPKEKFYNEWVKKDAKYTKEAEYKKNLRYKKWAEKWDGFNPEIEGVNIPDKIASIGLKNASDFFMKELKEDFI